MWSNFHTHSNYCDGKGELEDYLRSATAVGLEVIGFSSHAPLPFPRPWCMKGEDLPRYLAEIESLKHRYDTLTLYKGLEIDYIPGVMAPSDFRAALDYTIGSVHFVDSFEGKYWEIDNTVEVFKEGLRNIFHNDIRGAVTRYLELTREMVLKDPPDVVGHLDKIKMQNSPDPFFEESEAWYREEVDKTLKAIRQAEVIVEVNTRGLYKKKTSTPYPGPWILERIRHLGIPVTISSDAHHPDDLTKEFQSTAGLLREIGFKNLSILKGGIWKQMPFNEYGFVH